MVAEPSKARARHLFERRGYEVEEIPLGAEKSAELRVRRRAEALGGLTDLLGILTGLA